MNYKRVVLHAVLVMITLSSGVEMNGAGAAFTARLAQNRADLAQLRVQFAHDPSKLAAIAEQEANLARIEADAKVASQQFIDAYKVSATHFYATSKETRISAASLLKFLAWALFSDPEHAMNRSVATSLSPEQKDKAQFVFEAMLQYQQDDPEVGPIWKISDRPFFGVEFSTGEEPGVTFKKIDPIDSHLMVMLNFFGSDSVEGQSFINQYVRWLRDLQNQGKITGEQVADLVNAINVFKQGAPVGVPVVTAVPAPVPQPVAPPTVAKPYSPLMNAIEKGDATNVRNLITMGGATVNQEHIKRARQLSPATRYTEVIALLE
jgi:hypothetical protein